MSEKKPLDPSVCTQTAHINARITSVLKLNIWKEASYPIANTT